MNQVFRKKPYIDSIMPLTSFLGVFLFFAALAPGIGRTADPQAPPPTLFSSVPESEIKTFYRAVASPAWIQQDGTLNEKGQTLFQTLRAANEHGLKPHAYGVNLIASSPPTPQLEDILTRAALKYIRDLKTGRSAPKEVAPELYIYSRAIGSGTLLATIYQTSNMAQSLEDLAPSYPEYALLKKRLAAFREIERDGGWRQLAITGTLRKQDRGDTVIALRHRLKAQHYLPSEAEDSPLFDDRLEQAVILFQNNHGLEIDGKIGPQTLQALNVPVQTRIRQIILNMERRRWLPHDLGERHIRVNIAGFYLKVFENNQLQLHLPIVVGKPYRKTPLFSTVMTDIIFHPYWHVPSSIASSSVIPEIIRDRGHLKRQGFEVLHTDGQQMRQIENPENLPWETFHSTHFPYLLRQKPGPRNALGSVRFSIRNSMAIYLHGTPDQGLFAQANRAKSSGCIRISDPLALLHYLLRRTPGWDPGRINNLYNQPQINDNLRPVTVPLEKQIPVHILYWTAWATPDSDFVQFRDDIYGRDSVLSAALLEK
jgi:L,D-transpeptidase YcbB